MRRARTRSGPVGAALAAAVGLAAAGCGSTDRVAATSCPVTQPGGPRPPGFALLNFGDPIARASDPGWYGNGTLWTELLPPTVIRDRGQMLRVKMGWFRARTGAVTITGAPLHGPSARFTADVGTPAEYGPTGFAASVVEFGRPGCWQLRAHLAGQELALVLRIPAPEPARRS
jgi:hypothetical protein